MWVILLLAISLCSVRIALAREIEERDMGRLPLPVEVHEDYCETQNSGSLVPDPDRLDYVGMDNPTRWIWSYGAPYVASSWVVEGGNSWYRRNEYRRAVYLGGQYMYNEYVGTKDTLGGSVWSYGSEFVNSVERVEAGNNWFTRRTYSRPVYRYGVFQYHQHVRTVEEPGGSIWTYGTEYVAEETTVDRGDFWYKVRTYRRPSFKYGVFQGNEIVRVEESPGGSVWSYGPAFVSSETREERGNTWYIVRTLSRQVLYHGNPHHLENVGRDERLGGEVWTYSQPRLLSSTVESLTPPHLHLITNFGRDVYHYGTKVRSEALPTLREVADACVVETGEMEVARAYTRESSDGRTVLVTEFHRPIFHSNPAYGKFIVGYRDEPGATQVVELGTRNQFSAQTTPGGQQGATPSPSTSVIKRVARVIRAVEEFDDSATVLASDYIGDIKEALSKGIIFGKFDELTGERPYDPESLITLGEMVNILARNYGGTGLSGLEARDYLVGLGASVGGNLDRPMSLGQIDELARSLAGFGIGAADLLVLREARDGTLRADRSDGITRAHAVAMFHTGSGAPVVVGAPVAPGPVPNQQAMSAPPTSTVSSGSSGPSSSQVPVKPMLSNPVAPKTSPEEQMNRSPIALFDVQSPVIAGRTVRYADRSYDPDAGDRITESSWTGKESVFASAGRYFTSLRVMDNHGAWSEPASREIVVVPALTVAAEVEPARCQQGQTITVIGTTNKAAQRCRAGTPWGGVEMVGTGGTWRASLVVPDETPVGSYQVVVTAYAGDEQIADSAALAIVEDPRRTLLFTLTD